MNGFLPFISGAVCMFAFLEIVRHSERIVAYIRMRFMKVRKP